jgi:hypothetical protein
VEHIAVTGWATIIPPAILVLYYTHKIYTAQQKALNSHLPQPSGPGDCWVWGVLPHRLSDDPLVNAMSA